MSESALELTYTLRVPRVQSRIFWLLVLVAHAVVAAGWWWLMPSGFPLTHPRFWVNQVLPPVISLICAGSLVAAQRRRYGIVRAGILMLAAMWLSIGIVSRLIFPISLSVRFLVPLLLFACMAIAAFAPALRSARWPRALTVIAVAAGLALGAWLPLTQRGDHPSTRPMEAAIAEAEALPSFDRQPRRRSLRGFDVIPSSGLVQLQRGRYVLAIQPMLTFQSRSPDRFWTIFAPPDARTGPPRLLDGYLDRETGLSMSYRDDARSWLTVDEAGDGWGAQIDATTVLPRPVYSHLNTFCEFQFAGHRRLFITFSPCPQTPIEVVHFDYPVGDPARFAYLDVDGTFRIVQASSGEKGPFRTLAQGEMARDEPLIIIFHDREVPIARVELLDWARQLSTALSPTAGWRVPVNAVEFSRDTSEPDSVASIFVTLAGTSVGRGWDSVGHAAGTYRSRIHAGWVE